MTPKKARSASAQKYRDAEAAYKSRVGAQARADEIERQSRARRTEGRRTRGE